VAGNLPYQITGPLLAKAAGLARQITRAVFLVQKEVADRLVATPGTKEYGALSVFLQAQFEIKKALSLKPGAFHPPPRVDSAVCVLLPREVPISEETPEFRRLVKAAFAARRKTLKNAWRSVAEMGLMERVAAQAGVSLDARGETLGAADFARVAEGLAALSPVEEPLT
jgi:16S rRNA (adenine1518-N6/adenine1519-N6)-dimethyltransferase